MAKAMLGKAPAANEYDFSSDFGGAIITSANFLTTSGAGSAAVIGADVDNDSASNIMVTVNGPGAATAATTVAPGGSREFMLGDGQSLAVDGSGLSGNPGDRVVVSWRERA